MQLTGASWWGNMQPLGPTHTGVVGGILPQFVDLQLQPDVFVNAQVIAQVYPSLLLTESLLFMLLLHRLACCSATAAGVLVLAAAAVAIVRAYLLQPRQLHAAGDTVAAATWTSWLADRRCAG